MDSKISNDEFTVVLLAAGYGSRISNYTDIPKCLIKVAGRSIIERSFDIWHNLGIKNIHLVLGYKKELIIEVAKKYEDKFNFKFIVNEDFKNLGNTYSLKLGIDNLDGSFLIFDADLVYEEKILRNFLSDNKSSILIGEAEITDIECAKAMVDNKNYVRMTIDKRAISEDELCRFKFAGEAIGILKFSANHTRALSAMANEFLQDKSNLLKNWEHLLNVFLPKHDVESFYFDVGRWIEIDTQEDYLKAEEMFYGA